jgi:hypothetical protein
VAPWHVLLLSASCPSACLAASLLPSLGARCGLRLTDEVSSPLISGDVDVRLTDKLLQGHRSFLEDGSDEGQGIGLVVEVLDHGRLSHIEMRFLMVWNCFRNERRDSSLRCLRDLRSQGCIDLLESDWKFMTN